MTPHECREVWGCMCTALWVGEDCPIHGAGEWPPRCGTCGRFVKWPAVDPSPEPNDQQEGGGA